MSEVLPEDPQPRLRDFYAAEDRVLHSDGREGTVFHVEDSFNVVLVLFDDAAHRRDYTQCRPEDITVIT